MTIGLRLLTSLIDSETGVADFVRLRVDEELFLSESERELFDVVNSHIQQYGKLPSRSTLKSLGFLTLPKAQPEPPKFYFDKCRERYVFTRLKAVLKAVEGDLNDDKPALALERMTETMSLCQMFLNRERVVNITTDMADLIQAEYKRQYKAMMTGEREGLMMGWPSFDRMTNGLRGGDLITVVGRPGAGKTYLMLHAANTAWMHKQAPLFLSMEMKPLEIMQRVTAMLTKMPITSLKGATLTTSQVVNMKDALAQVADYDVPYWIVDGALTATITDAILLAQQLKPGVIFVDGAYLMRGGNPKSSRWEKLTEIAERLKGDLAGGLNVPVVISYQFNRGVKKSAKAGSTDLGDIAYTDAIGQLSSVVLGLLQEEDVKTAASRTVEILKGRNGENGEFLINWNFDMGPDFMNFTEIQQQTNIQFA